MRCGLLVPLVLACSTVSLADGGDVPWQRDVSGHLRAITAAAGQVVVAGQGPTANGEFVVGAYDSTSGRSLWQDLVDKGGRSNQALAVTQADDLVFVVGSADHDLIEDSSAFLVRTYNARGEFIWEDEVNDGRVNVATSVVADHERVFAGGLRKNASSGFEFVLRAYHARSGTLLWEKDLGRAPVPLASHRFQLPTTPLPLCALGKTLITSGATPGSGEPSVQAYDARTGQLLWQDRYRRSGSNDRVTALVAKGDRAFAIGSGYKTADGNAILIRSIRASDGLLLWQNQYESPDGVLGVVSATAPGDAVFIAGYLCKPSGMCELLVLAYDGDTGALRWQRRYDAGSGTLPIGMAAESGRVFVVGSAQPTTGVGGYFVRAYSSRTGQLEWWDQSEQLGPALGIAASGGKVFVGGFADPYQEAGELLRAYRAR